MIALALVWLAQEAASVEELFPTKEGFRWVYASGDNEGATAVAGRQKIGDVECVVLQSERKGGAVREFVRVTAEGASVHRIDAEDFSPPIPRFKGATKKGDTWEWKGKLGGTDATVKYVNEGVVDVKVAAGAFKAWKVTSTMSLSGGTLVLSSWYAPKVGLVLQESEYRKDDDRRTARLELKSYEAPK